MTDTAPRELPLQELDEVIIRFAGDSGDGMQLTGDQFTSISAALGNDLATLPEFPAEIRAPQGTLAGVSAFQVRISDFAITTPGDAPTVLVAMNPAALKAQLHNVVQGGAIIVNTDAFNERNLEKAGYDSNPLEDGSLDGYRSYPVPMSQITRDAVAEHGVKPRDAERSKNFFALGLISWMYTRPIEPTMEFISTKFRGKELVIKANEAAFYAGYNFGETAELFESHYEIKPAELPSGEYTNINGNTAISWGCIAAGQLAQLPIFLGSYPITPASDILHDLSALKHFGARTFQAEDEIAAAASAIGAAFGGALAFTTTSGPGIALKGEGLGLAVSLELPLVIIDIQRGGPSTGLPTKPEQADLMMAMYGRHSESPMPIVAPRSPADCFNATIEACRIALRYRTPVMLLSDGYLATSSEPWLLPDVEDLPDIGVEFHTGYNGTNEDGEGIFLPYLRDPETLARPWAIPGTPDLMHRIGGIEKEDGSGNISYDPENHQKMVDLRAAKIEAVDVPDAEISGDSDADFCMLGWGSTWGAIDAALARLQKAGKKVAHIHLTHLNPLPKNLGELLSSFDKVICPEMNAGQLVNLIRAKYLIDVKPVNKMNGVPFTTAEIESAALEAMDAS
ncbi:MAG: 2-oxoacid:acceptor oxidoreductase subunit alpha [Acidimicrobiales bacterium]|uniref:Pyruvate:ferredoxin oxidoreductase and related 2-oxoacid:ferredoxin oxidoreductases, alpha subunit n=1 Tax=uncultured actinobacterium HF0130_15N16 TaxID=723601 RepID=E7C2P9_9ACTN|nr:pyruvate:ferredoxin oxidoreductase and related 2-oxoacid:ferredoxin oxidoreductases, alpha subunit [uncultured actinobacterium HF0130_15N16]MCH2633725.1 2-oxoacid:acceptor oxidoreductase subunit alpha [Acidimicrobiales bacterium]